MKNSREFHAVMFMIFIGAIFWLASSIDRARLRENVTEVVPIIDDSQITKRFEPEVIDACVDGSEDPTVLAYCSCIFNELVTYTNDKEFLNMAQQYELTGTISQVYEDAMFKCESEN